MDTKVIWCYPAKRYIFTAIEKNTKIAFARMYKNNSSYSGRDFLLRLYFLLDKRINYLHSDNGSEFHKHFEDTCKELGIKHYWSRPRTPKDHAEIERFNRTLEEEFLRFLYSEGFDFIIFCQGKHLPKLLPILQYNILSTFGRISSSKNHFLSESPGDSSY